MIQIKFTTFIIPALISFLLAVYSSGFLWRRRNSQGAIPLSMLFVAIAIWSLSYFFLVTAMDLSSKIFWLGIEYIGIIPSTLIWMIFCLQYTGTEYPQNRSFIISLIIVPLITLILTWTNDSHHLMWTGLSIAPDHWGILDYQQGPWFWVHFIYSYSLYGIGMYFLVKKSLSVPQSKRPEIRLVIFAGILPGLAEILSITELKPFSYVDLTSLGFIFTGLILLYTYYRHHFMDLVPIARETTLDQLEDAIIIAENNDRIVNVNLAAEQIFTDQFGSLIGLSIDDLLPDLVEWIALVKAGQNPEKNLSITDKNGQRVFSLKYIPLTDTKERSIGYTIIFQDQTEFHNLTESLKDQADRLEVLYEIGKAITSTLKVDALLELIYTQLSKVIRSDAYFVALYLPETHQMDIRILFDEGKRHPSIQVDASDGLSSWVVENKKPLLIQDLRKEMDYLPVKPVLVGEKRLSRSWLGVPLMTESNLIGIIAVASYEPNEFDNTDKLLMEQIGQQAVLSIQNARNFEEVSRQSKLDSLTGVSNHNHFIETLHKESEITLAAESPLSLIMLDIDYFKLYNDTYGHTIGDQVLRLTVQAIDSNIKNTDTVGRWGGEEFGIVLPNATTAQANMVANRIRRTLSELPLFNVEGQPIPKPTISQGIATLPDHTNDVDELVIIADRALYRAKDKGRDQVAVGFSSPPKDTPKTEAD